MNDFICFFIIIVISLLLTELIRRYSLKKKLIDTPNDRSSHTSPTPRGGGLSIVIIFLISIFLIDTLSENILFALSGSGLIIAAIGFLDDHGHIPAKWRLLSHFMAAVWVLLWLGEIPEFHYLGFNIELGLLGMLIVLFSLVWLLNLFNFMDGIDGIAASEAIFVSCSGAYFCWLSGIENLSSILLLLAAAAVGFLILNWPPAKIFMGDVGSAFLGMIIGIVAYASILQGLTVWIWLILLAVFLVDSGITLLRRILNGDKWYEAHCSHAYQHAAKRWGHRRVTLSVISINLFWLFPMAYITYINSNSYLAFMLTLLTFLPLILVAYKLKAGINVIND